MIVLRKKHLQTTTKNPICEKSQDLSGKSNEKVCDAPIRLPGKPTHLFEHRGSMRRYCYHSSYLLNTNDQTFIHFLALFSTDRVEI